MGLFGLALASFAAVGCSSTTTTDLDASAYVYPDTGTGPTLYALSDGTYCYDITGVSLVSDGCGLQVASLVGTTSLLGDYVASTGQFTLGTEGSLGTGLLSQNTGTLQSIADTSDGASCAWHQTDTTILTMTGKNTFSVAVTEQKSAFSAGCGAPAPTCTSTWTWTMGIDAAKLPAGDPLTCP
jgi:hypothetical protein